MKENPYGPNADCLGATITDYGWSQGRYNPIDNPDQLGLEIEFEGVPDGGLTFNAPKGWAYHNDGSLRGGGELVSNGPRTIEQINDDLDAIIKTFADNSFTPVFSFRTSLHVHINIGDLTHLQLLNMFALYTIFEQPMLEIGGEERVGNVHCMPVFLAPFPVDELRRGLSGDKGKYGKNSLDNALRNLMRNEMRYSSFNWASIAKFGTVEYRSHRGTLDKPTIMKWCRLILRLKKMAKKYDNPQQIVADFSRFGPLVFAQRIFPDHDQLTALCDSSSSKLWEGLRNVQMFAFATNDWRVKSKAKPTKTDTVRGMVVNQVIHDEAQVVMPRDAWAAWVPQRPNMNAEEAQLMIARQQAAFEAARRRVVG